MREVNVDLIEAHTAVRFRSEYDYALGRYYRNDKVIAFLDNTGLKRTGRAADCGCGGMSLALANWLAPGGLTQDVLLSNIKDVLAPAAPIAR